MSGDGRAGARVTLSESDYPTVKALGEELAVELARLCIQAQERAEASGVTPLAARYGSLAGLTGTLAVAATAIAKLERDEAFPPDTERLAHFGSCILGHVLDVLARDLPWPEGKGGQA